MKVCFKILLILIFFPSVSVAVEEQVYADEPIEGTPETYPLGLTLYSKVEIPCDKQDPQSAKCHYFAIYDKRDDIIYVVKKAKTEAYGEGGFDRNQVISAAQSSIDLVNEFSDKSTAVDNASAYFQLQDSVLKLKLKVLFTQESEHTEKELTITY